MKDLRLQLILLLYLRAASMGVAGAEFRFVESIPGLVYNAISNTFSVTEKLGVLTLSGPASALISRTNAWSVSIDVDLSARSFGDGEHVVLGFWIMNHSAPSFAGVSFDALQENNIGGADHWYPSGWFSSIVEFSPAIEGGGESISPLGSSITNNLGGAYLPIFTGSSLSNSIESLPSIEGRLSVGFDPGNQTLTGRFNEMPVASYLASGETNSAFQLNIAVSTSSQVAVGTLGASNFSVSGAVGRPTILSSVVSGQKVRLSIVDGASSASYIVLASLDLTSPLNAWTPISTNVANFDGSLSITITNGFISDVRHRFLLLKQQ